METSDYILLILGFLIVAGGIGAWIYFQSLNQSGNGSSQSTGTQSTGTGNSSPPQPVSTPPPQPGTIGSNTGSNAPTSGSSYLNPNIQVLSSFLGFFSPANSYVPNSNTPLYVMGKGFTANSTAQIFVRLASQASGLGLGVGIANTDNSGNFGFKLVPSYFAMSGAIVVQAMDIKTNSLSNQVLLNPS